MASIANPNLGSGTQQMKAWVERLIADKIAANHRSLVVPLAADYVYQTAANFPLTTTWVSLASATLTVPATMTRCVMTLLGSAYAINPNTTGGSNAAGGDAIQLYVVATPGGASLNCPTPVLGGGGASSAHSHVSQLLAGLTAGQTVTVAVWGRSTYATLAANASNVCDVSAHVTWQQ